MKTKGPEKTQSGSDGSGAAAAHRALQAEVEQLRAENAALTTALRDMEHAAQRDVMTGLFNRRYFLTALQRRVARVARYAERAAIIYVDVDGLKAINDRLGHGAGDKALLTIATTLHRETRESDIVARIGGDEFALLIDHVSAAAARGKMDALSVALAAADCRWGAERIALSAAFGMTMIEAADSAEDLLCRADTEMYRAKRSDDAIAGRPPGS